MHGLINVLFRQRTPRTRSSPSLLRGVVITAAALAGLLSAAGCETNAATGRRQFNTLSRADEIALGEQNKDSLTGEYGGEVPDPSLQAYVENVGRRLAVETEAENPSLPWEFTLLDSEVVNAFALPGGKVFVSRGLVQRFGSEAELASVIGHEIGHVTARHVNEAMARQMGVTGLAVAAGVAASVLAGDDAGSQAAAGLGASAAVQAAGLIALKFDRDQEIESDALGMRYMVRAGYNPIGSMRAMQVLADLAGPRQPDFLSTHPDPGRRVVIIRDRLERQHPEALEFPSENTFAERYQREFLAPLNRLRPIDLGAAGRHGVQGMGWCALCAAAASEEVAAGD